MSDEHRIPLAELEQRLNCSSLGLTKSDAIARQIQYGLNSLQVRKDTPEIIKFLHQFTNLFAVLLMAGSGLAFLAEHLQPDQGNLYIAIALLGVVFLNAVFTYTQEYESERIMESFRNMLPTKITVLRSGVISQIEAKFLVPGDVMMLEEGDRIPADGRLIEVNQLKVDHSPLTGESEPQLRKLDCTHSALLESRNMVFSGTLVQSGNGKALVYATGMHTQIGRIVQLTKEIEHTESAIRKELKHFTQIISIIAVSLGGLFFAVSMLLGKPLISSLIFAIGIIVANVPEGLLPTVTLALSMASQRMAKNKALIRNLEAVETLGATTVICTDKTGTITQNSMKVTSIVLAYKEWSAFQKGLSEASGIEQALACMVLCNNARLTEKHYLGDPTEGALLIFAKQHQLVSELLTQWPRLHESPFDSTAKRMITSHSNHDGIALHYMKGAPEVVMTKCSHYLQQGNLVAVDEAFNTHITDIYERLAARGERVLALAYKTDTDAVLKEEGFIYIGLVGMLDPPRPEISAAIDKCQSAGIRIFMITGDYHVTAESIARQVGLFTGKGQVILGSELEQMSDAEFSAVLDEQELVFARTSALQKLQIVKALQKKGEVVTVTGDGVNDAPALKNADMGVAMGLSGTEVAKEAANIVLMDDNFATIVKAIEEGRTIYANIKKFIAYILSHTVPEMLPFIAFIALGAPLALTVLLILLIDLATDMLPALGLGKEPPDTDVMSLPPRKRSERLLTKHILIRSYGVVGLLEAAAGFFAFFVILYQGGWTWGAVLAESNLLYKTAVTGFFAAVILCQVVNVLICSVHTRSVFTNSLFANKMIWLGITFELALVASLSYMPALQVIFGTAPLTVLQSLLGLPFALLLLSADELRRALLRRENLWVMRWLSS
ncbi:MAG: cation-transporting P-type ATPase [Methylococcales bacterium]|nr:cation-transporting P-type ATPase [Methylococcales bacterium]